MYIIHHSFSQFIWKSYISRSVCQYMVVHKSICSHHCPLLHRYHHSHRDWVHNLQSERKKTGLTRVQTDTPKHLGNHGQVTQNHSKKKTSITKQLLESIRHCNPFELVKSHFYCHWAGLTASLSHSLLPLTALQCSHSRHIPPALEMQQRIKTITTSRHETIQTFPDSYFGI